MNELRKETVDELLFRLAGFGYDKVTYVNGDFLLDVPIEKDVKLVYDKSSLRFGIETRKTLYNMHSVYIDQIIREIKHTSYEAKVCNMILRRGEGLLGKDYWVHD